MAGIVMLREFGKRSIHPFGMPVGKGNVSLAVVARRNSIGAGFPPAVIDYLIEVDWLHFVCGHVAGFLGEHDEVAGMPGS